MPYNLIFQIIVFSSLGAVVIILGRALPRIEDESVISRSRRGYFERISKKIPLERLDEAINIFLHKALRKIKIVLMKADNVVSEKLHNFSKKDKSGGPGILP